MRACARVSTKKTERRGDDEMNAKWKKWVFASLSFVAVVLSIIALYNYLTNKSPDKLVDPKLTESTVADNTPAEPQKRVVERGPSDSDMARQMVGSYMRSPSRPVREEPASNSSDAFEKLKRIQDQLDRAEAEVVKPAASEAPRPTVRQISAVELRKQKDTEAEAKEQELRINDRIKDLKGKIYGMDRSIQTWTAYLDKPMNADKKSWCRGRIEGFKNQLSEYKEELEKAYAELSVAQR